MMVFHHFNGVKITAKFADVDFLRCKSDLPGVLGPRMREAETRHPGAVKTGVFISDNGGEHVNPMVKAMLAENGTTHRRTAPECQWQNPAERMMQTVKKQ